MEETAQVYETPYGEVICERCGFSLESNDCGDMPDYCPKCGAKLDWSIYDVEEE